MADPYFGEIILAPFGYAPRGWAICDGSSLLIAQNAALFSILGTFYGGDGIRTFSLPDLRGIVPIGAGQGPGLTARPDPGTTGGAAAVTLDATNLPAHTHTVHGSSAKGNKLTPAGNTWAADASGRTMDYQTAGPNDTMQPNLLGASGGGQPHNNRQPFLGVTFIIALQGIFPTRN